MPQKKNPDPVELVRATAGTATGELTGLLTTLKGLPRAYNLDLQEATPHAWTTVDSVSDATVVVAGAVATADWNDTRLADAAGDGFSTATGIADLIATSGLPFRTAHEIVATAAERVSDGDTPEAAAAKVDEATRNVTGEALSAYVRREDVEAALDPVHSVASRDSAGGPAPEAVSSELETAVAGIETDDAALADERTSLAAAAERLDAAVVEYV